jgi:hypothetical protein
MARSRHQDGLSVLQKHRHLETNSLVLKATTGQPSRLAGPPMAGEDLGPRIPPTASRAGTVGDQTSWPFTLAVRLPGLGHVRLLGSCKNAEWTGPYAVLVRTRGDGHAPRLITRYWQRWPSATFSQDGQGHLGLDEYRMRNAAAMQTHGCLVCVADALVPLDCLPPSPTQGSLPITTIGEACRQQAQARMQAVI